MIACLLIPIPAEGARGKPINYAVGGVQMGPMTADLLKVHEKPYPDSDTLQVLGALRDAVGSPVSARIAGEIAGKPVAVKQNRLKGSEYLAEGLGEGFEPVQWEGVFTKGDERREAIEQFAASLIARREREPGRPINVVCHSHGCGIALEAFELAGQSGVRINKFVTTGTRLTGLPGDNVRDKPENVGEWVNIFSRHDQALSKSLDGEGIFNVEFTGGDDHPHLGIFSGHGMYYGDPAIRGGIVDMLDTRGSAEKLLKDRYADVFDLPPEASDNRKD